MMSERQDPQPGNSANRCPSCDSIVPEGATRCIMCGEWLAEEPAGATVPTTSDSSATPDAPGAAPEAKAEPLPPAQPPPDAVMEGQPPPEVVESVMRERQAPVVFALTAVFTVIIVILSILILQYQSPDLIVALVPSPTSIPPTQTLTATWTPLPTETSAPTETPTITPTPAPTDTPRPPRSHLVTSGETLIGLSLLYRISPESIAEANGFTVDAPVRTGQSLQIPWPSPTPPLEIIAVEINGETVLADPTGCERYQIQEGDSVVGIASQYGINFELLAQVNRLNDPSLLRPGDTLCIPKITYGDTLPPTPGPSPTPTATSPPPGPHLLYPVDDAVIDPPDGMIRLQWAAVKDLAESEWYMIELADMDEIGSLPHRGFTRDTAFQVPGAWRPTEPQTHAMRWRVSIVRVTGWRSDGLPIYTYGGESSEPATFSWLGAVPTPTPTPTTTVTPER
ncbi:MAG TPA: LysM peptidoglycan-binding domain-containing protein [Anaerolineae bacterium]